MSIFVICSSAYSPEETRRKIGEADERYHDVLKHFWISGVGAAQNHDGARAAEHGLIAHSTFLIQWNKEGGSEYIPEIPRIIYEVFGRDKVLVFDLDYELIPPS